MDCNIIFFANNEKHAKDVLKRMFEFVIENYKEKLANQDLHREVSSMANTRYNAFEKYLHHFDKIKITLAPTDQFYKVGWAFNDTIV